MGLETLQLHYSSYRRIAISSMSDGFTFYLENSSSSFFGGSLSGLLYA